MSALYQSSVTHSAGTGISVGGGHVFGGPNFATVTGSRTNSVTVTQLAQSLAPPAQPVLQRSSAAGCFAAVLIFMALPGYLRSLTALFQNASGGQAEFPWAAFFLSVLFSVGVFICLMENDRAHKRNRWHYERQMEVWSDLMGKWDRLFYCPRCDCVYDPASRRWAPSHSMSALLQSG